MSCGTGRRCGSDLVLLWLWWRPAATAPIQPLAWETPYATGTALKERKKERKKKRKEGRKEEREYKITKTKLDRKVQKHLASEGLS